MGKATDFRFSRNIHRVHPNKSSLKILEKSKRGRIQTLPPIISGTGKVTNFKFCTHIHRIDRNKNPLKFWEKYSHGRCQGLPKMFRSSIYKAYRAVIFAIAHLSCFISCITVLVGRWYSLHRASRDICDSYSILIITLERRRVYWRSTRILSNDRTSSTCFFRDFNWFAQMQADDVGCGCIVLITSHYRHW